MTEGYLAVFDVLGFRALMKQPLGEVEQVLSELRNACNVATWDFGHLRQSPRPGEKRPVLLKDAPTRAEYVQVSDTIILRPLETSADPLGDLVQTCTNLLAIGFTRGIRLRGAITRGEYGWNANPPVVFGKALLAALDWEKRQDWFGAVLDPETIGEAESRVARLRERELVVDYLVPMKEGPANTLVALAWPRRMVSDFSQDFAPIASEWTARRKEMHSESFYRYVKATFPGRAPRL